MAKKSNPIRSKRGRPSLPRGAGKRFPLNMRTTKERRDQLKGAAEASGRSLAQEVEYRVERSFLDEAALYREFGGEEGFLFGKWFAMTLLVAQQMTGRSWLEDAETFLIALEALKHLRTKDLSKEELPDEATIRERGKEAAAAVFRPRSK